MANEHMERNSASLVSLGKCRSRHKEILVRMAVIKGKQSNCWWGCGKVVTLGLLVGLLKWCSHFGKQVICSPKCTYSYHLSQQFHSQIYIPKRIENMFTEKLLSILVITAQMSINWWAAKQTVGYLYNYLIMKRNDVLIQLQLPNLENTVPSEKKPDI